jgi:preprotein translocase subunit YajC
MDLMLVLPLLLLVVMMIFMWRSNKKRQEQQQEMRQQLVPGTEVMTQAGIYGTIVEVDTDNNVATIESGPGTVLRVHSATIVNVVTPTVPDDASALTDDDAALDDNDSLTGAYDEHAGDPYAADSTDADATDAESADLGSTDTDAADDADGKPKL